MSKEESTRTTAVERVIEGDEETSFFIVPLRVRVTDDIERDLDRIEAYFQGRGYRHVRRSHLVRIALERFAQDIMSERPEIADITLRG